MTNWSRKQGDATRTAKHTQRLRWRDNIPKVKEGKGKYPKRNSKENVNPHAQIDTGWSATSPRLAVWSRATHEQLMIGRIA